MVWRLSLIYLLTFTGFWGFTLELLQVGCNGSRAVRSELIPLNQIVNRLIHHHYFWYRRITEIAFLLFDFSPEFVLDLVAVSL